MDLLKSLTGKDITLSEQVAKILVDNPDVELFKKLVKQDDFLFDFVKNNVAKRIQKACNKDNYLNLINFLDFYSPYYDNVITEALFKYGGSSIVQKIKDIYINGNNNQKAYALKYFTFLQNEDLADILPKIRETALSDYEPVSVNSVEVLAKLEDEESKRNAIEKLSSTDEFEQYDGVKFLVTYGAKDTLNQIIDVMKKSSLSENIASEIPYMVPIEELLETDFDNGILVLCNIINAIPEIIDGPYYKGVDSLSDSSVNLLFIATVKEANYYVVQIALNREIKLIFDENDVSIPFPQITVNQPEEFSNKVTKHEEKQATEFFKEQSDVAKNYEDTNK